MNVLIFGGSGFIGRKLTSELVSKNYNVYVVTRNIQKTTNVFNNKVKAIQWDNNSSFFLKDPKVIDVVINLAGESIVERRWSETVKNRILFSRLNTTKGIVNAINSGSIKPNLLINASAVGYYGSRKDDYLTESEKSGDGFLANICRIWENEAYKVYRDSTRVVTIRTGIVLGNEGALNKMLIPFKFFLGGSFGDGKQWLSWIHINDLTSMIEYIINDQNLKGPINATAPEPTRMKDFIKVIGEILKKPSCLMIPGFILKLVLGKMSEMVLFSQRVIPNKILSSDFEYKFPQVRNALKNVIESRKTSKNKNN